MKKKRKHRSKRKIPKLFVCIIALGTLSVTSIICCLTIAWGIAKYSNSTPEFSTLEEIAPLMTQFPPARRERLPEAEIEYESLKQALIEVVDNTEISPFRDDSYIDYWDHCLKGHFRIRVRTKVTFTEVIQRYNEWAINNGWIYREYEPSSFSHEKNKGSYEYLDPYDTRSERTHFTIEPSANHTEYYYLDLYYIDRFCDEN